VVSGLPFDVFLKKRLFDTLGMSDTWFCLPENKAKRLVSVQHKINTAHSRTLHLQSHFLHCFRVTVDSYMAYAMALRAMPGAHKKKQAI